MTSAPSLPTRQETTRTGPSADRPPEAATRHLCAAAYLDDDFRDSSLLEVYHQPRRMVAPSYGFAMIPVLRHCLRARNAAIIRDAVLVGAFILVGLTQPVAAIAFACLLIAVSYGVRGFAVAGLVIATVLVNSCIVAWIAYLVGIDLWRIGAGWDWTASDLAAALRPTVATPVAVTAILILVILALPVMSSLWRQRQVDRIVHHKGTAVGSPQRARLAQIDRQQRGNTVVYAGYETFIGSGVKIRSWKPFTVPLLRRKTADGLPPDPGMELDPDLPRITADEVMEYVVERLASMTHAGQPVQNLPGLTVNGRVYLSGREVTRLWYETPLDRIAELIRNPTGPARCYLVCQVVSWQGELVTTIYVQFAVEGQTLNMSIDSRALLPCKPEYEAVDHVHHTGIRAYTRAFGRGLRETAVTAVRAPDRLLATAAVVAAAALWTPVAAQIVARRGFRYGARTSLRELGMVTVRNDVQRQDIEKYESIMVHLVVLAVIGFLDRQDIDTSWLRQHVLAVFAKNVHTGSGDVNDTTISQQYNTFPPPTPPTA